MVAVPSSDYYTSVKSSGPPNVALPLALRGAHPIKHEGYHSNYDPLHK